MELEAFHDDCEDFVELVGGETFDVLGTGIEVTTDVGEYSEVSVTEAASPSKIS